MTINYYIGIDPGPEESAYCILSDKGRVVQFDKLGNIPFLQFLGSPDILHAGLHDDLNETHLFVIEMLACYGMAVGAEVLDTARWVGRFQDRIETKHGMEARLMYRKDVKMTLCHTMKANDSNIRQQIIDMYGGKKAIGKKKTPGPLYGLSGDCWSALAICLTAKETLCNL
jgi:hypothetical protein